MKDFDSSQEAAPVQNKQGRKIEGTTW